MGCINKLKGHPFINQGFYPYLCTNSKPMDKKSNHKRKNGSHKPKNHGKQSKGKSAKKAKIDKQIRDPNAPMRLNKYIANAGICSRRDADIYIASGNVRVNGKVVTEMGYKVNLSDEIKFDGRRISPGKKEYVLLNKPRGFYVTGSLEKHNRTVMDLVSKATKNKITPIGDLATGTKGLLLFTNDGTLKKKLARTKIRQMFHVGLNHNLSQEDLEQLQEGIRLEDGFVKPKAVDYVTNRPKREVGLEIISDKPQIVQRLFKKLGYEVESLDRVTFGGLTKKDLPRGRYRHLKKQEVINLGML